MVFFETWSVIDLDLLVNAGITSTCTMPSYFIGLLTVITLQSL